MKNLNNTKTRTEFDLIGERQVPKEVYYGIQTLRALENFDISGSYLYDYPEFINALAEVKEAAAKANRKLGILDPEIADAIIEACQKIKTGDFNQEFVVDMIQGGAGTSMNMNANEVIANIALEILGYEKGNYQYCHPNNHVNLSQSTNDAYPSALKICIYRSISWLEEELELLIQSFMDKSEEFKEIIKMGRTQLQDAVPMTLGQEFKAFEKTLSDEINQIKQNKTLMLEVNLGATAIGTGINADPDYAPLCINYFNEITGLKISLAENLIEATSDTGDFVTISSVLKRLALKLSKISNDLRLLSSGPRTGFNEINLPAVQPGSSIMPGKVNPVIPEVMNQIAFRVMGNDLTVCLGAEAGQLQLNVMEPIMAFAILENIEILINGMKTFRTRCINGIIANPEHCKDMVNNSVSLVTALNPYLGYDISTKLAAEALKSNRSIIELILEQKLIEEEKLMQILSPQNMIKPRKYKS